jgi:hypothetical protein
LDDTLTVLTNRGDGTFGFNATLPARSNPIHVIAIDLNGDGKRDLACVNLGNTLTVLLNLTPFPPAPALGFGSAGSGKMAIFWPAWATNYVLQSSTNLSGTNWTVVTNGAPIVGVIVSLFGMVNTMVLSVFERTREIGMLRTIGMTRRQARRMIRHESVITALIGAALGLGLGLFLSGLASGAVGSESLPFTIPVMPLIAFTLLSVIAGIGAAIMPARRASRLNVLDALHYE